MADVFISYASEEFEMASSLSQGLQDRGIDTWWDARLRSGERFDDVIINELRQAAAVVLIWSEASAASDYVRMEGGIAWSRNALITFRAESFPVTSIPKPFEGIHADVVSDIERLLGAIASKGIQVKKKKLAADEVLSSLTRCDPALKDVLPAWLNECRMAGFRVVANRSRMIKSTIPTFGDINFGTLYADGRVQTNYISDSADRFGDPSAARDYLDGVAALIPGATVRRDGKPWTWRVEVFGELPRLSTLLVRGQDWIELMRIARDRFNRAAASREV